MNKAKQVVVEETFHDGTTQRCAAIQIGDNCIVFADNGFVTYLNTHSYIKVVKELSWIDISEEILGN